MTQEGRVEILRFGWYAFDRSSDALLWRRLGSPGPPLQRRAAVCAAEAAWNLFWPLHKHRTHNGRPRRHAHSTPRANMRRMKKKQIATWRIYEFRSEGRYIGSVTAADDKAAIEKAIEEFGITDPRRQRRLVAQRES
jgi:hypothetical protein